MVKDSKQYRRIFTLLSMMSLMTLSSFGFPSVAYANGTDGNEGLPDGTIGGGSRGGSACSSQDPLLVFAPGNQTLKTTEGETTLWFYLPDSDVLTNAELIVYDEQNNPIVDTTFSVAEQSGLFGVNLNSMIEGGQLDPEKEYRWFFSLLCPNDRAADIVVDGWVQATTLSPSLTDELKAASPADQAHLYLQEGLWSEAVQLFIPSSAENSTPDYWLDTWQSMSETLNRPESVSLNFATVSPFNLPSTVY